MKITSKNAVRRVAGVLGAAVLLGSLAAGCSSPSSSNSTPTTTAAAQSSSAGGTETVSYQLGWLPTVEWGGNWIADSSGDYKNAGVDFQWLPGGPNVTSETVVASGKALVGSSNADTIAKAIAEGADLKIFGAAFQKNPFCIMSLAGSPINTPQDMIGKKIGVAAGNQTAFDLFLKINNIDPSQIQVVPVQYDPAPLANKEVDGQVVFAVNEPTQLAAKGIDTHTMLFADHGYDILADVFVATNETIEQKPQLLANFLKATRQGYEGLIQDPAKAAELTVNDYGKDQGFNLQQQTLQATAMKQLILTDSVTTPIALPEATMEANIKTIGLLGIDVNKDQLFTTKILDMVNG